MLKHPKFWGWSAGPRLASGMSAALVVCGTDVTVLLWGLLAVAWCGHFNMLMFLIQFCCQLDFHVAHLHMVAPLERG